MLIQLIWLGFRSPDALYSEAVEWCHCALKKIHLQFLVQRRRKAFSVILDTMSDEIGIVSGTKRNNHVSEYDESGRCASYYTTEREVQCTQPWVSAAERRRLHHTYHHQSQAFNVICMPVIWLYVKSIYHCSVPSHISCRGCDLENTTPKIRVDLTHLDVSIAVSLLDAHSVNECCYCTAAIKSRGGRVSTKFARRSNGVYSPTDDKIRWALRLGLLWNTS